jgi:7-carboxy-7-deazaguanine synthase
MNEEKWYQVNELFTSIQGEGILMGTPATFIRLQGCPVGCVWCDSGPLADDLKGRMTNGETRNTWGKGGEKMSVEGILTQIQRSHVIITGGEPTIWNLDPLLDALHAYGYFTQLETSGLQELKGTTLPRHITISPKERLAFRIPPLLGSDASEIKWVVDDTLPYQVVEDAWLSGRYANAVFVLMPEGCPPSQDHIKKTMDYLQEFAHRNPKSSSAWVFGDRLQYRLGLR